MATVNLATGQFGDGRFGAGSIWRRGTDSRPTELGIPSLCRFSDQNSIYRALSQSEFQIQTLGSRFLRMRSTIREIFSESAGGLSAVKTYQAGQEILVSRKENRGGIKKARDCQGQSGASFGRDRGEQSI